VKGYTAWVKKVQMFLDHIGVIPASQMIHDMPEGQLKAWYRDSVDAYIAAAWISEEY